jgi:DNA-binding transcriptional LysR family regulator
LKIAGPEDIPYAEEVFSEKLNWVGGKNILYSLESAHPIPLVLSPDPCIYRNKALKALEEKSIKWRILFSSSSYTSKVSAVKAGFGLTVMPKSMIHGELKVIDDHFLPQLDDMHVSLLKNKSNDSAVLTFEKFILEKFRSL